MRKNKEFADRFEEEDFKLLEDFNQVLNLKELGQCPYSHHSDASGITTDGKVISIELKRREQNLLDNVTISGKTYTASTLYIETHKVGSMLMDYVYCGITPLYINFLNDGVVVVHNLVKLSKIPNSVCKKIYSNLYQSFELSKRLELPLMDAWIYRKEADGFKIISKPIKSNDKHIS